MELMKNSSTSLTNLEDNTRLLFFENYKNEKNQYNVEEIFFGKAILLQQIRILKSDSNPHPKIKSMQSITQAAPIYNFEIFARNLKKYSHKFECIFESSTINESGGNNDCIFPLFSDFITNHIVIRGMFEKITLCVYGIPYTGTEGHLLLETAKNDVPLEKLQNTSDDLYYFDQGTGEKINLTNDDIELLNNYTIESLISPYIKCEVMGGLKRAYYINPPNVNMVEKTKTGYIYYENDLIYYSQCLYNFYLLNENKNYKSNTSAKNNNSNLNGKLNSLGISIDEISFQTYFKKVCDIIKILIANNFCFLEEDCVFRTDNNEVFKKLPESLVEIIISALEGKVFGHMEVKNGLKLLKMITNSSLMVSTFVDKGGFESLYSLLLKPNEKDNTCHSLVLKVLALENIYRLITHSKAFTKFMDNLDRNKFQQQYFMIKEYIKDPQDEGSALTIKNDPDSHNGGNITSSFQSKKKSKGSDRDKDKKKSKKEKKSKKDRRASKSKSRSRSRSRDRSRTFSKESRSSEHSNQYKKTFDKKQAKNVLLKNGYQIILTLIIGKRNNLIVNMVRKIINKVSFLLYLKEFTNFIENVSAKSTQYTQNDTTSSFNPNLHFDKVTSFLQKIFEYLLKIDISYKKSFDKDAPCVISNDYPYRNFWIEYLKINRKFFKKTDNYNLKSTIEHENNFSNKISDSKIITNEIAIMLEENNFLENLIILLSEEKLHKVKQYIDYSLLSKNILSYLLLCKGGINFFSKNFELTMILRNFLIKSTDCLLNNSQIASIVKEENFYSVKVQNSQSNILLNKSLFENDLKSNINNVIINMNSNMELSEDFIIKINLLQLRYFLELQFVFLTKFDDIVMFKIEDIKGEDYIDKSLDILLIFSQNINRSNLSKQAFTSLFQNEYFIEEIITLIKHYLDNDSIEYEAHITLILEILTSVFTDNNKTCDVMLLLYGSTIHEMLVKLRSKMQAAYDNSETDPVNREFYSKFDSLINFFSAIKTFNESKEIKTLMVYINECLFNNIQKYNLNEKPVNEDNLKDENIKEYVKGLKLNILNYLNSDVDYLETIRKKSSLINELFVAVKIINLSIRINPLLLIDCVSEHIHLALRYLIVNTVHALKNLLSNETKEYHCNVKGDSECDRFLKIKEYSIFLYHLYEILSMLLKNLLSSHVDNYRDNIVIDNTVNLLIVLINYLFEIYSYDKTSPMSVFNNCNLYVVEYVQKLFESVLLSFKEICKFNTTIKLNFEKILEKFAEKPSNKAPMIYILNFMFNIVNNEYTIETFVEHFIKVQKAPLIDVFSELESPTKNYSLKIGQLSLDKTFLHYVIEIAINSNNEWLMSSCANLLLSIQRSYLDKSKGKIYEDINDYTLSILNSAFNKISRVNATIMEDKEIESFLPNVDLIYRLVKFIIVFLKSEYKFIYIFHDIANIYSKILNYFNEYIKASLIKSPTYELKDNNKKLTYKILDILNLLMNSFIVICDSKEGFRKQIPEENSSSLHYDLVEELPSKLDIINILRDISNFFDIENLKEIVNSSSRLKDQTILNKYLVLTNKSMKTITRLNKNFYGQTLLLYSDYPQMLPNIGKPAVCLDNIIKFTIEKLNECKENYGSGSNIFSFVELADNIVLAISLLFYDMNYFEVGNNTAEVSNFLYTHSQGINSEATVKITETRFSTLLYFILGKNFDPISNSLNFTAVVEILSSLALSLKNIQNENITMSSKVNRIIENIQNILRDKFNLKPFNIISSTSTSEGLSTIRTVKLPNARKILDKYELIRKYYEFYSTQNYAFDLPIQQASPKDSSASFNQMIIMNKYSEYSKQHINEFEKLLNWKKYRIYLSKMDNLIVRTSIFDLDLNLKFLPDEKDVLNNTVDILSSSVNYKKMFTYVNNEPFEQFCNQMLNESLLLNKFANLSYFITSSTIHGSVFLSEDYCNSEIRRLLYKNPLFLKCDLEFCKSGSHFIKGTSIVAPLRTKKKINSKLNTFVYKPKYDKLPKQLFVQQVPTTMSIRDSSRYSSVVSGRPLSTHVDKVNPTQGVVNLTYSAGGNVVVVVEEVTKERVIGEEVAVNEEVVKAMAVEEKETLEAIEVQQISQVLPTLNAHVNLNIPQTQIQNVISVNKTESRVATGGIVNPQLNLRMMTPQNFMSNTNPNFMPGGFNPMGSQMGMSNIPQSNPMLNFGMVGQGGTSMQYNFPNIRQPMQMTGQMNPMMNTQNPYAQNFPLSSMNKNMPNISNLPNMPNMNMPMNMQPNQFNYSQMNSQMGNFPMQNQQNFDMQRMNSQQSTISTQSIQMDLERKSSSQSAPQNIPQQGPSLPSQPTPTNINLLTNILQAYTQLSKQGQPNQPADKSKDPRTRKNKK